MEQLVETIYTESARYWFDRPEVAWTRSQMCCRC
jgi:hypothetical protein